MKIPSLQDDLYNLLPLKLVLTNDVKGVYYVKKTSSSGELKDITLPKGTVINLSKSKYSTGTFDTDKTMEGMPVSIPFKEINGKADIISQIKPTTMTDSTQKKPTIQKTTDADQQMLETNRDARISKISYTVSSIGLVSGLVYCFAKNKSIGAYIGYSLLFSIVGSISGNLIARAAIKK